MLPMSTKSISLYRRAAVRTGVASAGLLSIHSGGRPLLLTSSPPHCMVAGLLAHRNSSSSIMMVSSRLCLLQHRYVSMTNDKRKDHQESTQGKNSAVAAAAAAMIGLGLGFGLAYLFAPGPDFWWSKQQQTDEKEEGEKDSTVGGTVQNKKVNGSNDSNSSNASSDDVTNTSKKTGHDKSKRKRTSTSKVKVFTKSELTAHNGANRSLPLFLVVLGDIFDVTEGRDFYGTVGKGYNAFVGHDASRKFVDAKFDVPYTDADEDISDLDPSQVQSVLTWRDFYRDHHKYTKVGVLHGLYYDSNGRMTATLRRLEEVGATSAADEQEE